VKALLDTSVLISDSAQLDDADVLAVASLSYAELEFGATLPSLTTEERALRRSRLARLKLRFGPGLPFDDQAAVSYGIIAEAVVRAHRQVRGRAVDLLIAAIAHANQAALITDNGADFAPLHRLMPILTPAGKPWV